MDNVIEATSVFEILITVFHIKKSNYPVMCDLLFGYFFLFFHIKRKTLTELIKFNKGSAVRLGNVSILSYKVTFFLKYF